MIIVIPGRLFTEAVALRATRKLLIVIRIQETPMNEYWEITQERGVATQAVWGMQPTFKLKNLDRTQHGALVDSLHILAQERDNAENHLTESISAKHTIFRKLIDLGIRVPGVIDGMLDDEDDLKDQLAAIYGVNADSSEANTLRRARLVLPFWTDVDAASAAAVPPEPPLTVVYHGVSIGVNDFSAIIDGAIAAQKTEAEKLRLVTNAKSALRTAEHKTDRGNKRWYKAWLKAYPEGTPEGDAAQSQIFTGSGTPEPTPLNILSANPSPDARIILNFDPAGGDHATTKELQYQLPGELEFGHSTPISSNTLTVGPFTPGFTIAFRTRVSNSNPGFVVSPTVTAQVQAIPPGP